jgi:chromosome segregation ATPase
VRRTAAALLIGLLALGGAACANKQAEALRAEIARLRKDRVEKGAVEKEQQEAARAGQALEAVQKTLADARQALAEAQAQRDQAKADYDAAVARNAALRAQIEAVAVRARAAAERGRELDAKITTARSQATWVRDEAAVLAREIRPTDPAWATERRLDTLAQFLDQAARLYPGDPVLAELARTRIERKQPTAADARQGSELAARLRDRMAFVYDLDAPGAEARAQPTEEKKP